MSSFASPLEIAAVVAAAGGPLAAGLGVVLWSKLRAAGRTRQQAELDVRLRTMFDALESRPSSPQLNLVVDALEEAKADPVSARKAHVPS
jgi:hypothetical protein